MAQLPAIAQASVFVNDFINAVTRKVLLFVLTEIWTYLCWKKLLSKTPARHLPLWWNLHGSCKIWKIKWRFSSDPPYILVYNGELTATNYNSRTPRSNIKNRNNSKKSPSPHIFTTRSSMLFTNSYDLSTKIYWFSENLRQSNKVWSIAFVSTWLNTLPDPLSQDMKVL